METNLYPVVETSKGLRIHRATCKRFKAEQQVGNVTTHRDVTELATCCKPAPSEVARQRSNSQAATADTERDAAEARIAELRQQASAGGPTTFEAAVAAVLGGADPEETADQLVANQPIPDDVDEMIASAPSYRPPTRAERVDRLNAADVERKAVREWEQGGEQGPRPETLNLDSIKADKDRPAEERIAASRALRTTRGERGTEARAEAKRAGKRGKGRKVTADELDAYVAGVRSEHPESSQSDELEYAYWIEKLAVSRPTWNAAWERVTASQTTN